MKTIFKPPFFIYEKLIKKQKEFVPFIIFFFFLLTFILSRAWVYLGIRGIVPDSLTENVNGVHVHHFAYGVLINSLVGFIVFVSPRQTFEVWKHKLAAVFGVGLGWTFDEFGMWMRLRDDYWMRSSYDAIVVISVFLINIVYFTNFWKKIGKKLFKHKS